ncbi:hypothetical protein Q1695_005949 [Nippostrongylus brasiliensis]|nr:hypothetical protein Q1695_005949 [Nippostrongylus brasiliensis]
MTTTRSSASARATAVNLTLSERRITPSVLQRLDFQACGVDRTGALAALQPDTKEKICSADRRTASVPRTPDSAVSNVAWYDNQRQAKKSRFAQDIVDSEQ